MSANSTRSVTRDGKVRRPRAVRPPKTTGAASPSPRIDQTHRVLLRLRHAKDNPDVLHFVRTGDVPAWNPYSTERARLRRRRLALYDVVHEGERQFDPTTRRAATALRQRLQETTEP